LAIARFDAEGPAGAALGFIINIIITIKITHVAQQDEKKAICFVDVLNTFAKGFHEIKRSDSDPSPAGADSGAPAAADPGVAAVVPV
jgi:hypothetical protein